MSWGTTSSPVHRRCSGLSPRPTARRRTECRLRRPARLANFFAGLVANFHDGLAGWSYVPRDAAYEMKAADMIYDGCK